MGRYVTVGDARGWPVGRARTLPTSAGGVAVWRVSAGDDAGAFRAVGDTCPHAGGSLGEGALEDGRIVCALHDWAFDPGTGACTRGGESASVPVYAVERRGHEVGVVLNEGEEPRGAVLIHDPTRPRWMVAAGRAGAHADDAHDAGDADD